MREKGGQEILNGSEMGQIWVPGGAERVSFKI